MSILEDNKVLACFVGHKIHHISEDERLFLCMKHEPRLAFLYEPHKDWNQLMEAVEKIEGKCLVYIGGCSCRICTTPYDINFEATTKIQAVYQAVLEYIKKEG